MSYKATGTQNMAVEDSTGIFYARLKINQRLYYRSLETDKITNAKRLLADKLKEIRESVSLVTDKSVTDENRLTHKATFQEAHDIHERKVMARYRISVGSKETYLRPFKTIKRAFPELLGMEIRRITHDTLNTFIGELVAGKHPYLPNRAKSKTVAGDSPSQVNKVIDYLRAVFAVAIAHKVVLKNPAADLEKLALQNKLLVVPSREVFGRIVEHVRTKAGRGRIAGDLVEGLAYSGIRIGESRRMLWRHLDFSRDTMQIFGTKSLSSKRDVPMVEKFKMHILKMREHHKLVNGGVDPLPDSRVFECKEATTSLAKASVACGMVKMTHHDLRDFFATTCIEAGVDIPTVSSWLGHNDGGVLCMKVYGHIRPAHSVEAAKKVKFA